MIFINNLSSVLLTSMGIHSLTPCSAEINYQAVGLLHLSATSVKPEITFDGLAAAGPK